MVEQIAEQLGRLGNREHRVLQARVNYRREKMASGEIPPPFAAIVIPSYGMSGWEGDNPYRLSFFGGVVTRAAFEFRKNLGAHYLKAPPIIIEGAVIFPGDPKNDGDLMRDLLIRLGVPESEIVQRRDNHNTYEQLLDSRKALAEMGIPQHEALYIHAHLHRQRIPKLLKNYRMDSYAFIAEDVLSSFYPAFAHVWNLIKSDPSYREKAENPETWLTRALWVDPRGALANRVSTNIIFPRHGADVPDVRHRQTVRSY